MLYRRKGPFFVYRNCHPGKVFGCGKHGLAQGFGMGVRHKETVVYRDSHNALVQEREHDPLGNVRVLPLKPQSSASKKVIGNGLVHDRQGFKSRDKPPVPQAFREGSQEVIILAQVVARALDRIGTVIRVDRGQHQELEHGAELTRPAWRHVHFPFKAQPAFCIQQGRMNRLEVQFHDGLAIDADEAPQLSGQALRPMAVESSAVLESDVEHPA